MNAKTLTRNLRFRRQWARSVVGNYPLWVAMLGGCVEARRAAANHRYWHTSHGVGVSDV